VGLNDTLNSDMVDWKPASEENRTLIEKEYSNYIVDG
jgi:hypothetical protein